VRAEAYYAECAVAGQRPYEKRKCADRKCHPITQRHAAAAVDDKAEVEVGAIVEPDLLGFFVFNHFKQLLWLHRVECGHKRDSCCDLVRVWHLGVVELGQEHVGRSVKQLDRASDLSASDQDARVGLVLLDDRRVDRQTQI